MTNQVEIKALTAEETLPLRCEVLRPDRPIRESVFAGDDASSTEHWGVLVNDTLIAVASIYAEPLPEAVAREPITHLVEDVTATTACEGSTHKSSASATCWRLRGMAVSPQFQGQGYGKQLLNHCLQSVAEHGGSLLWCNARTTAVVFYRAAGFQTAGSEFVIPDIGPHYVMLRPVGDLVSRS